VRPRRVRAGGWDHDDLPGIPLRPRPACGRRPRPTTASKRAGSCAAAWLATCPRRSRCPRSGGFRLMHCCRARRHAGHNVGTAGPGAAALRTSAQTPDCWRPGLTIGCLLLVGNARSVGRVLPFSRWRVRPTLRPGTSPSALDQAGQRTQPGPATTPGAKDAPGVVAHSAADAVRKALAKATVRSWAMREAPRSALAAVNAVRRPAPPTPRSVPAVGLPFTAPHILHSDNDTDHGRCIAVAPPIYWLWMSSLLWLLIGFVSQEFLFKC
jgi:hypothetical protein